MSRRSKRKFDWNELSSEEEEVEVKKIPKKDDSKAKKIDKKDEKKIEDQADKLSKLSVKPSTVAEQPVRTSTRSVRGSVKRELDFESETDSVSSKKAKTTSRSTIATASVKEESPKESSVASTRSGRTVREERPPTNEPIKTEKVSPKKATKKGSKASTDDKSSIAKYPENGDHLSTNMLVKKDATAGSQEDRASQAGGKELQLPVINIKSIKMKLLKPQTCKKKFNKQYLHSSPSPTKPKPLKFTEIKIDLSDEQRDWFNKQLEKYDGIYDKEFDLE